jgi:hypothetical protein
VNDRPTAEELLGAVERFLREEVVSALEGPRRFHARVAANVVGMVGREIARGDADLRAEWGRLAELLGSEAAEGGGSASRRRAESGAPGSADALRAAVREANEELARRIRAGEADAGPWREVVIAHLKQTVAEKLAVALPPRREGP